MSQREGVIARPWTPGQDTIPDEFFQIPVYQNFPNAHPDDPKSVRAQFTAANEYFQTGKAWIGLIPGKTRVVGMWKPDQELGGQNVAYFGFWETMDDVAANRLLFDELTAWAKSLGAKALVGPVNFSTFGNYRIRHEGSASDDIFMGEPFTPPYYERLLTELGLASSIRYESIIMPVTEEFKNFLLERTKNRQHPAYSEFQFKPLDQETWHRRLPEFHELTMTFFKGAAGFKPMSYEMFKAVYGPVISVRQCPHSTVYMTTADDRIMAYLLCFPNYGSVVRRDQEFEPLSGADLNFSKAFPLMKKPELIAKTIGVHPDFRGRGLQHVLTAEGMLRAIENGYKTMTYALMREGNASNNVHPDLPHERRLYLLFAKTLESK